MEKDIIDQLKHLSYEEYEDIRPKIERTLTILHKFHKGLFNINNFISSIRNMDRPEQADAIKNMYNFDTIQTKIAFAMLDEQDLSNLKEELFEYFQINNEI